MHKISRVRLTANKPCFMKKQILKDYIRLMEIKRFSPKFIKACVNAFNQIQPNEK